MDNEVVAKWIVVAVYALSCVHSYYHTEEVRKADPLIRNLIDMDDGPPSD